MRYFAFALISAALVALLLWSPVVTSSSAEPDDPRCTTHVGNRVQPVE